MIGEIIMDEIGDILKQARLDKGYSLNDVQQITKIQKRYLAAIEEGDFDVLPGDFYTRAFIRQYADVVGVDSDELLNQHKTEVPNPQTEIDKKPAASTNKPLNKKNDPGDNLLRSNLPKILVIILVLAIVIALYYAWVQNSANNESIIQESNEGNVQISSNEQVSQTGDSSESQPAEESESESEESETSQAPDSASVALEDADGTNATYSLMIPADQTVPLTVGAEGGDSWISIDQDGSNVFQGTLADGDESSHDIPSDATEVYITLGNAPASVLEVDGTAVDLPEENSGSITQRLTFNVTNEAQE